MQIIKDFPIFNIGDVVKVDPKENGGAEEAIVFRTWYPKEGDNFSESKECATLGYLNSKPKLPFPQLMLKVTKPESMISDKREGGYIHICPLEFIEKIN